MTDVQIDPLDLVVPARYGRSAFPHEAWTRLRAEDPVHWCEPEGYRPGLKRVGHLVSAWAGGSMRWWCRG